MSCVTSVTLLQRVGNVNDRGSWHEFTRIYGAVITRWLISQGVRAHDTDDIVQEVMTYVSRHIANFEHNGRSGAFRSWLRRITVNRMREAWRARDRQHASGLNLSEFADRLADNESELSRIWQQEHDRSVLEFLMTQVTGRFHERSLQAFRRIAIEQRPAEEVATELGMTIGAVRVAQSRVLRALREIGRGLTD